MDAKSEDLTTRRSTGRARKSPERFVAGAASGKRTGDPVQKKRGRKAKSLAKQDPASDDWVDRRIEVQSPAQTQWQTGIVTESLEDSETRLRIAFDNGDTQDYTLAKGLLRTASSRECLYKWVDGDTTRPSALETATEHKNEASTGLRKGADTVKEEEAELLKQGSKNTDSVAQLTDGEKETLPKAVASKLSTSLEQPWKGVPQEAKESIVGGLDKMSHTQISKESEKDILPAAVPNQPTAKEAASVKVEGRIKRALDVNASAKLPSVAGTKSTKKKERQDDGDKGILPDVSPEHLLELQKILQPGQTGSPAQGSISKASVQSGVAGQKRKSVLRAADRLGVKKSSPTLKVQNGKLSRGRSNEDISKLTHTTPQVRAKSHTNLAAEVAESPKASPSHNSPSTNASKPAQTEVVAGGLERRPGSPAKRKSPANPPALSEEAAAAKRQKTAETKLTPKSSPALAGTTPKDFGGQAAANGKGSRTTSLAAPLSLNVLPTELAAEPKLQRADSSDNSGYDPQPEPAVKDPAADQLEADIICKQLTGHLAGLTRARDSIGRATSLALAAAAVNAAPRVVRTIADCMESGDATARRIDLLYLVDSVLQGSQREGKAGCGPGSAAAEHFPRVIAAALPRFMSAISISAEGVEKAAKIVKLDAARASFAGQAAGGEPAKAGLKGSQPGRVHLALNNGNETVSAVLEDQYGTHNHATGDEEALLLRRDDSSDDESDDEPDEHERELRAQTDLARQQEAAKHGISQGAFGRRQDLQGGWDLASSPVSNAGWDPAKTRGIGLASNVGQHSTSSFQGPPGFSPNSFATPKGINIQLVRKSAGSRSERPLPPISRSAPATSGYQAPAVSAVTADLSPGFADDDRLDMAGAADRTFATDQPPLPDEDPDWSGAAPPLPKLVQQEPAPPLPDDSQPPLPAEPPPPIPDLAYNSFGMAQQPIYWEPGQPMPLAQQPHFPQRGTFGHPFRPRPQQPHPRMHYF